MDLADLAEGLPINGRFQVVHPRTRELTATVSVFVRWTDPLAVPARAPGGETGQQQQGMIGGEHLLPTGTRATPAGIPR